MLTFYLRGNLFGIDILAVKEIDHQIEYAVVPQAPHHIVGLLNMRGQVVTLYNLASLMGYERENGRNRLTCIILKNTPLEPDYIGFLIDQPGSVVDIEQDMCEPPPANMSGIETKYISEVAKLEKELLLIINHRAAFSK